MEDFFDISKKCDYTTLYKMLILGHLLYGYEKMSCIFGIYDKFPIRMGQLFFFFRKVIFKPP